jgi:hypothetical protein
VWCSDDGVGSVSIVTAEDFRSSKINEVDFSLVVDNGVFRFDVPVDDVLGMEVLDGEDDGAQVEAVGCFVENADFSDCFEHFDSVDVLEEETDIFFILVGCVVSNDEGMAETC